MTTTLPPGGRWLVAGAAVLVGLALTACDPAAGTPGANPAPPAAPPAAETATVAPAPGGSGGGNPPAGPPAGGGHSSHPAHGTGVRFDPAKIPAGDRGSDTFRVRTNGEFPRFNPDEAGVGAFRTVCRYSHMNTDDPIVVPRQPGASHLHMFWGNTKTDAFSTAETIARSGNGTCRGGIANRTAYWAPAVIDTRTGAPLAPELIHVYYKSAYQGSRPDQIQPLPDGLRMVAGNAKASAVQDHMGWGCFDGGGRSATIPRCRPGDHVSMDVEFPSCWDGQHLDSDDHKKHMAYGTFGRGCPASHPVALPVISYHVLFPVSAGTDTSTWRLSSDTYDAGLPGGFSVHGE
jgi:hypothetical protein